MRRFAIAALACAIPALAMAQDGPQSALQGFVAGYRATDGAAIAALFRSDGTFFGSGEAGLLRGPDGVLGYFTRAWPPGTRRGIDCETLSTRMVTPDIAVVNANCHTQMTRPDGQQNVRDLRLTGVVMREGGRWLFADLHASNAPGPRR